MLQNPWRKKKGRSRSRRNGGRHNAIPTVAQAKWDKIRRSTSSPTFHSLEEQTNRSPPSRKVPPSLSPQSSFSPRTRPTVGVSSFAYQKMCTRQRNWRPTSEALPTGSSYWSPNLSSLVFPQVSESVETGFIHSTGSFFYNFLSFLEEPKETVFTFGFAIPIPRIRCQGITVIPIKREQVFLLLLSLVCHLQRFLLLLLHYGLGKMIPLLGSIGMILGLWHRLLLTRMPLPLFRTTWSVFWLNFSACFVWHAILVCGFLVDVIICASVLWKHSIEELQ